MKIFYYLFISELQFDRTDPYSISIVYSLKHVPTFSKIQQKYCEQKFRRCTLSLNSPLKANWFSGFPSGTLYLLNQSTVASRYPGLSRLTSSISATHQQQKRTLKFRITRVTDFRFPNSASSFYCKLLILLKLAASGSSVLITMTFQSVSPSSIKARVPSTFTLIISPRVHT